MCICLNIIRSSQTVRLASLAVWMKRSGLFSNGPGCRKPKLEESCGVREHMGGRGELTLMRRAFVARHFVDSVLDRLCFVWTYTWGRFALFAVLVRVFKKTISTQPPFLFLGTGLQGTTRK